MHPNQRARAEQQQRIVKQAQNSDAYRFFDLLTGPELLETVESLLPEHRERLFPPTETLSMFLAQALSADRACQNAVNEAALKRLTGGLAPCSTHTGAYCAARQRLPEALVSILVRHSGRLITARAACAVAMAGSSGAAGGWHDGDAAGHASQSSGLSPIPDAAAGSGFSAVPSPGVGMLGQWRSTQCGGWTVSG